MRTLQALFGQSPFEPLREHAGHVVACARLVPALVDAVIDGDAARIAAAHQQLTAREHQADAIKNGLRDHLPRRLFLPVDRRDLLEILDLQDSVADVAEDLGDLFAARRWVVPAELAGPLRALAAASARCAEGLEDVHRHLAGLVHAGFGGPEVDKLRAALDAVLLAEDAADEAEAALQRAVFAQEDALGAVALVVWMQLVPLLGDLADYAKKACNRLRLIVAA